MPGQDVNLLMRNCRDAEECLGERLRLLQCKLQTKAFRNIIWQFWLPSWICIIMNQIYMFSEGPKVEIHMKTWESQVFMCISCVSSCVSQVETPSEKNCRLYGGKYDVEHNFAISATILRWALFEYFLGWIKQRYIWKIETLVVTSVGSRHDNGTVLSGA